MSDSFYCPDGERFLSHASTRGPWHPEHQHAGPPSALLARSLEADSEGFQLVRLSVDLLRPVPVAPLSVHCEQLVGGRRRWIREAELRHEGRAVARARALLLRVAELPVPAHPTQDPVPPPPPEAASPYQLRIGPEEQGFVTAMDMRRVDGGEGRGAGRIWMRQRLPLLPEEAPSPLQRLMLVADCGNGVSAALDPRRCRFANPDLTVNLRRPAVGEWLCLDAWTHCQPHGLGMAESRIWDRQGVVANGTQNLLLEAVES